MQRNSLRIQSFLRAPRRQGRFANFLSGEEQEETAVFAGYLTTKVYHII